MRISDWSSDVCSSDLLEISPKRRVRNISRQSRRSALCASPLSATWPRPTSPLGKLTNGSHWPKRRCAVGGRVCAPPSGGLMRSEEHTSELQSLMRSSYAVFCFKQKRYSSMHLAH